ncbi:hypothetical protein VSR01_10320 [Actinacidiphila sp. DG2A-62]|uniref:hypothetical protein n=1 Tax=Actinacidiphila sp. DG2A-62 TaxID=3108821 RepID=UPI002DBDEFBF|nr:hypothetical protein [Actinacidiphila sp. DG2A-62]MEC3993915.1 hypothetical protein [Actinacidiphila sp. DG2A-62]
MNARLLPWTGEDGKPAYLVDDSGRASLISRMADNLEAVQLGMGQELVGYAKATLENTDAPERELRHVITCLIGSLEDALRIAASRGDRLPPVDDEEQGMSELAQAVVNREIARRSGVVTATVHNVRTGGAR